MNAQLAALKALIEDSPEARKEVEAMIARYLAGVAQKAPAPAWNVAYKQEQQPVDDFETARDGFMAAVEDLAAIDQAAAPPPAKAGGPRAEALAYAL